MTFTDLEIKRMYDSYSNDMAREFFDPILSEAKMYLRAAAYFSSSSLKAIGKGLASLLSKGGKMKLIAAILLSEADYDAIIEGKKLAEDQIFDSFFDESATSEMLCNDSVKALFQLVSARKLDIKFILSKRGIFHMKFGIFEDYEGNMVSFSGSLNETYEGYEINGEEIKAFRSWVPGENYYVQDEYSRFYSYWENRLPLKDAIISDLPAKVREKIEYTVASEKLKLAERKNNLRPYQKEAVKFFGEKNFMAILEMATGTGKTLVALNCAKLLFEKMGNRFTIIAVPTDNLVSQWKKEWKNFFGISPFAYNHEKSSDFWSYCNIFKEDGVVIMTYSSLSKRVGDSDFLEMIGKGNFIIADEAHWIGAPTFSKAMVGNFEFRLGLSATPERMFDEEGTGKIMEFFGNNEFEYSLQEAISDGYLSEFAYFPYFCRLTPDEIIEYGNLTKKAIDLHAKQNGEELSPQEIALIKRAKIAKKARCKQPIFNEIIELLTGSGKLDHLLVFFEDRKQLLAAQNTLISFRVPFNTVDASTDDAERNASSARLAKGEISCLLSMRVMDEGVDIPTATREILMASSSNERQYIQRAGRILRIKDGKGTAEIYDIIAYADQTDCPDWLWKYEINAIKKEIRRAMYFSKAATNQSECIRSLYAFGEKLNISIWG